MRFLIFASLWAHWSFISAAPADDLFALGPDESVSNLDFQSFGDGSNSWDLGFNSGLDQNSNYLPDDSMFGSADLASSITDTSAADTNAFTSSDDLFALDDPTDLIALQGSCDGTDSSVPSDMLTARDTGTCSTGQNQFQVPSLFTDPQRALEGSQKTPNTIPDGPNPKPPPPEKKPEEPGIFQLLMGDAVDWFKNIGGDGVKCPAHLQSRCCTYAATQNGPPDTPFLAVMLACLPSTLSTFTPFLPQTSNAGRTAGPERAASGGRRRTGYRLARLSPRGRPATTPPPPPNFLTFAYRL